MRIKTLKKIQKITDNNILTIDNITSDKEKKSYKYE